MYAIIARNICIIALVLVLVRCERLNQSTLIEQYGYSKDSFQIDLSSSNLDTIDLGTFNGFNNLEVIYLEDNQINRIEKGLFNNLYNLRELWLESNNLISINRNAFEGLNNLELVCLNNNPISTLFPAGLVAICATNLKCVVKTTEKCIKKSTSFKTTSTTGIQSI